MGGKRHGAASGAGQQPSGPRSAERAERADCLRSLYLTAGGQLAKQPDGGCRGRQGINRAEEAANSSFIFGPKGRHILQL